MIDSSPRSCVRRPSTSQHSTCKRNGEVVPRQAAAVIISHQVRRMHEVEVQAQLS